MKSAEKTSTTTRKTILKRLKSGSWIVLCYVSLLSLTLSILYINKPSLLNFLDNKLYDYLTNQFLNNKISDSIVIIDIDESSLSQYGQWPWPRYLTALLLEKIAQFEPLSVGIDFLFAEPDRHSTILISEDKLSDLNIKLTSSSFDQFIVDSDTIFANTLSKGPFVLSNNFLFETENFSKDCILHHVNVIFQNVSSTDRNQYMPAKAQKAACNLDIFSKAVTASGFFNAKPDRDGILRRVPLLIEYMGKYYPSLALATTIKTSGIKQIFFRNYGNEQSLRLKNTVIPLDQNGNMLIRFKSKSRAFNYIPAKDILNDITAKKEIQDKIVFVGTSAAGLEDFVATAIDSSFPGVEVHATIVDNILTENFFSKPTWTSGLELLLVIAFGIFSTLLLSWTRVRRSVLILMLSIVFVWKGSFWMLQKEGIFISPLFPILTIVANFSFLTLFKFWRQERLTMQRTRELALTQAATIESMAVLAEYRDSETGGHIKRTQKYVEVLARHLEKKALFSNFFEYNTIDQLTRSSILHDIGKIGVSDHILLKNGKFTEEEFVEIKKHTIYGRDAINYAEKNLGYNSILRLAREIAYTHHEKWDGTGYPQGLKGNEIPIAGRIMAVADIYDALISKRIYKPPMPHKKAVRIIIQGKGKHFDPDIIDAFEEVETMFKKIALQFADFEEERRIISSDE